LVLAFAGIALAAPACTGAPADDDVRVASESAFTVDDGDKFVISATPDKIVLSKRVGKTEFPFDAAALREKALLIHPVDGKAEGGVYLRAHEVQDDVDRLVVTGTPLTLQEMEHITEDEIVRIYIQRARPEAATTLDFKSVNAVSPLAFSSKPLKGVTVAHDIEAAKLTPTPLVQWSEENGLELGLRLDLVWKSKLAVRGEQGGEFFRTPSLETTPYVVFVPIGPVPVPITFTGSAFVTCTADVNGVFDASLAVAAEASVVGSVRIKDGVGEGPWPASAKGTVSVTPTFAINERMAIACTIPRIELRAAVAGVAGAYIAVVPVAAITTDGGPSFEAAVFAGVDAKVFGLTLTKETKLYSWKPL
jgi:hypothetical protein